MTVPGHTRHTAEDKFRISGAVLGVLVFLGGIALLGYVFITARDLFQTPPPTLPAPPPAGAAPATGAETASAATAIGQSLADFGKRILLLLLMCVAGSVISSRGIELFFKACAAAPPHGGGAGTVRGTTSATAPASTTP